MKNYLPRIFMLAGCIVFAVFFLTACSAKQESADPQIAAINAIRTKLELPDLSLTFIEMTYASNAPSSLPVDLYEDTGGRKYYIDPATLQVVEIDARSVLENVPSDVSLLPVEIRAKAQRLMSAVIPDFDTLQISWTYKEGNKGDNYFFSWYNVKRESMANPPFAQIALHKSGTLFAYYNTLFLDK
jgi:hypothetical protein